MSSEPIILFDIPSKEPRRCWTPNPWKTRLILNYKGLDYRTEWLEYPDIKPRLEPHLPPNPDPDATPYTIPAIRLPSGEYVMDSQAIAARLEALHPAPPLALDSPVLAQLSALTSQVLRALIPVYFARVPRAVLNEASKPYWYETRGKLVGMHVDELAAQKPEKECWDEAEQAVRDIARMLSADGSGGPFFLGETVSYADFVWGGMVVFLKNLGEEVYEELVKRSGEMGPVHGRLLEALGPWLQRDSE